MGEDPKRVDRRSGAADDACADGKETLPPGGRDPSEGVTILQHTPLAPGRTPPTVQQPAGAPSPPPTLGREPRANAALDRVKTRIGGRGSVTLSAESALSGPDSPERYVRVGEIARGGMGVILKLVDSDIRRPVAMKVILGDDDADRVARFVEEAQVTGQLEHPNIVPVHEIGVQSDGKVYFTMKLVGGESLEAILDRVAEGEPGALRDYPLARLLHVFLKVCDAVAFAHAKGVIHRDLKPENVMVGSFGEVLVMDWGLAKQLGSDGPDVAAPARAKPDPGDGPKQITLEGDVLGTPSYMPPEQADGAVEEVDRQSDVFSLGGILYQILTLQPPYEGETLTNILVKAVRGKVVPPSKRAPGRRVPAELDSICRRAMARKKGDRYPSVEALAEDVQAFLEHRLVTAHEYGFLARVLRFIQRHPAGSMAGGVALVLLSLGTSVSGLLYAEAAASAAKAREEAALKREAEARAEAQSLRAARAEEAKAAAEVRAARAEDSLEKGRAVSTLFRAILRDLGPTLERVKREYNAPGWRENRARTAASAEEELRAFEAGVPRDSASRAVWEAFRGWFAFLTGQDGEAARRFDAARSADPDVPYGDLFDALTRFSAYLDRQPFPILDITKSGAAFSKIPPESEELQRIRAAFTGCIEAAKKAPVWGESSSGEFAEALEGFLLVREGDLGVCEERLTAALRIPEMALVQDEILLARGKVRYLRGRIDDCLTDLDAVLASQPARLGALVFKTQVCFEEGARRVVAGEEGADWLRRSLKVMDEIHRHDPHQLPTFANKAVAVRLLVWDGSTRGKDVAPELERLVGIYDEILRQAPGMTDALEGRADARYELARHRRRKGQDPSALVRLAVEDARLAIGASPRDPDARADLAYFHILLAEWTLEKGGVGAPILADAQGAAEEALRLDPGHYSGRFALGVVHRIRAQYAKETGADAAEELRASARWFDDLLGTHPEVAEVHYQAGLTLSGTAKAMADAGGEFLPLFERARARFDEALRLKPQDLRFRFARGTSRLDAAWKQKLRGREVEEDYRAALEDFDAVLAGDAGDARALSNRALCRLSLGEIAMSVRKNPGTLFADAVADATRAIEIDPGTPSAYETRANAHRALGDLARAAGRDPAEEYRRAVEDMTKGAELKPDDASVVNNLSNLLLALGIALQARGEDGVPWFEKALARAEGMTARFPDEWHGHATRAEALNRLERFAEAADAYEKADRLSGGRVPVLGEMARRARTNAGTPAWRRRLREATGAAMRKEAPLARKLWEETLALAKEAGAFDDPPSRRTLADVHVYLARSFARTARQGGAPGDAGRAIAHLREALGLDAGEVPDPRSDPDFGALGDAPGFDALVKAWEAKRK